MRAKKNHPDSQEWTQTAQHTMTRRSILKKGALGAAVLATASVGPWGQDIKIRTA